MTLDKLNKALRKEIDELVATGTAKGAEMVINEIIPAKGEFGPRYKIEGYEGEFLKMNANSYLGMSLRKDVIEAEEEAAQKFGAGPGAVRFISGTHAPHIELEERLAAFHGREAAMIFSSAYVTSMGVIFPLTSKESIIISDELNHNCIIQGMRLTRPAAKLVYKHNDMKDLEAKLEEAVGKGKRVLVVTDGIFSMRGDHAPLDEIVELCQKYDDKFEEGVFSVVDDSHGVGAFGPTGRGTEEYCDTVVDILIGTLGKAFGVNGGYVVTSQTVVDYLRQKAPMYIYSNPITASEAAASMKAIDVLDSEEGEKILAHLLKMTKKFEKGLTDNGMETIPGDHPVVPLMVRDTAKTTAIVKHLTDNKILATGLNFPVVPKGDEEIRFQISADHTEADIDYVINVLKEYNNK